MTMVKDYNEVKTRRLFGTNRERQLSSRSILANASDTSDYMFETPQPCATQYQAS